MLTGQEVALIRQRLATAEISTVSDSWVLAYAEDVRKLLTATGNLEDPVLEEIRVAEVTEDPPEDVESTGDNPDPEGLQDLTPPGEKVSSRERVEQLFDAFFGAYIQPLTEPLEESAPPPYYPAPVINIFFAPVDQSSLSAETLQLFGEPISEGDD